MNDLNISIHKEDISSLVMVRSSVESAFYNNFYIIIPTVFLFRCLLQFIDSYSVPSAFFDFVKIPSEIALMLAIGCSSILFRDTRYYFIQILTSDIISDPLVNCEGEGPSKKQFVSQLDKWINHTIRVWIGFFSALVVFLYYILRIGGVDQFIRFINHEGFSLVFVDLILYILPSVGYSYFAGIIVWKVLVISLAVRRLPDCFTIHVQVGHPDGVGGLLPVGFICLKIVYVAVIPTVISALILIAPLLTPIELHPYIVANKVALFGLSPLVLLLGIVGSAIGLTPLMKYHKIMRHYKRELGGALNEINQRIIVLKNQLYA